MNEILQVIFISRINGEIAAVKFTRPLIFLLPPLHGMSEHSFSHFAHLSHLMCTAVGPADSHFNLPAVLDDTFLGSVTRIQKISASMKDVWKKFSF